MIENIQQTEWSFSYFLGRNIPFSYIADIDSNILGISTAYYAKQLPLIC